MQLLYNCFIRIYRIENTLDGGDMCTKIKKTHVWTMERRNINKVTMVTVDHDDKEDRSGSIGQ